MSRFNHSCGANTCYYLNEEKGLPEIRSLEEIKAGCEITVNYTTRSLAMKNRETRQYKLSSERGFECCCELCKKESTVSDDEKYERFEKMNHELDQLLNRYGMSYTMEDRKISEQCRIVHARLGWSQLEMVQKFKKNLSNLKEMYKLALEKKTARGRIDKILRDGIQLGKIGHFSLTEEHEKDSFFQEIEFFQMELKGSVLDPYLQFDQAACPLM